MDTGQINALVKQAQTGDQAAFAALYDEFAQRLYAFIRIKVADSEKAEDILQDVFLKAWTGCRKLEIKDLNFSAWLYKVTANTINDFYRKTYREPQTVPIEEAKEIPGLDDTAADASRRLEKQDIKQAMEKLPAHFKEVIELRFFQDFSIADTARILERNSITVRVWQHRATKELEKLFKQQHPKKL
ncbi:MAG TPA: RNA polymerase sigma factor [Patescibacteria group bacterium]|jgi:RNA polymerase sigma-70 factor (ECF subfamily)|nr:RNA polymerase sigma factor [Patescibacteria group bacterium]